MPSAEELGNVILHTLSSLFRAFGDLFIMLRYTGLNETAVNASREPFQSFWETWYRSTASLSWFRKLVIDGFVEELGRNSTLSAEFSKVVSIAANNSTYIFGNVDGEFGLTYLMRVMHDRLSSNPSLVYNFWYFLKTAILMAADALKQAPHLFPG